MAGPGNVYRQLLFFSLVLQNVMNIFVLVASYEYLRNHFKLSELSLSHIEMMKVIHSHCNWGDDYHWGEPEQAADLISRQHKQCKAAGSITAVT